MGRLAIVFLFVGIVLSFHTTLWGWAFAAYLAWALCALIEMRYNPKLWDF